MGDIPSLEKWKMVQLCKNLTFVIHFGIQVNNFDKQTIVMSLETVQWLVAVECCSQVWYGVGMRRQQISISSKYTSLYP